MLRQAKHNTFHNFTADAFVSAAFLSCHLVFTTILALQMLILNSGRLQIRLNNSRVPVLLDLQSRRVEYKDLQSALPRPQNIVEKNTNKSELRTQNIYNFTQIFFNANINIEIQ